MTASNGSDRIDYPASVATWTAEETQLLPVPASELVVGLAALVLIVLVVALVVWLIRRSANRSDTPT